MLVESAGGLLVPLAQGYSFAEMAVAVDLEVVVVVGSRLGALNQTLLTLEVVRRRGLRLAGYVVNCLDDSADLARDTNERALAELTDAPRLASFPFAPGEVPRAESEGLARALGLFPLSKPSTRSL